MALKFFRYYHNNRKDKKYEQKYKVTELFVVYA